MAPESVSRPPVVVSALRVAHQREIPGSAYLSHYLLRGDNALSLEFAETLTPEAITVNVFPSK
jgi:hypothetical protein